MGVVCQSDPLHTSVSAENPSSQPSPPGRWRRRVLLPLPQGGTEVRVEFRRRKTIARRAAVLSGAFVAVLFLAGCADQRLPDETRSAVTPSAPLAAAAATAAPGFEASPEPTQAPLSIGNETGSSERPRGEEPTAILPPAASPEATPPPTTRAAAYVATPAPEVAAASAVTPSAVIPSAVTPSAVTPSAVTPSAVTPSAVTPSAVTPSAVTPSAVTPSAVTPSAVTPSAVTPSAVTPSAVTPSAVTPSAVTPSAVTPSAVTPSAVTPSAVTPSAVTPSAVTPSAVTPSAVTPSAVTPSAVTPSAVTPTPLAQLTRPEYAADVIEAFPDFGRRLGKDDIRPIYNPVFVSAGQSPMLDGDFVLGLELNGEAHAYPIRVLNGREIVNDVVGGVPVLATW